MKTKRTTKPAPKYEADIFPDGHVNVFIGSIRPAVARIEPPNGRTKDDARYRQFIADINRIRATGARPPIGAKS